MSLRVQRSPLVVSDLHVSYRSRLGIRSVISGLSLTVEPGEFCVIVGDSGSGKTSLLNFIAGLLRQERKGGKAMAPWGVRGQGDALIAGHVHLGDVDWSHLEPRERSVGLVMQRFSLYPHMSVQNNLFFPLRMNGVPKSDWLYLASEALEQLGLRPDEYLSKSPDQLSGGQAQRVAIAKMLLKRPQVALLDEAFSHLDFGLRHRLRASLISSLCVEEKRSVLLVTHTIDDAVNADTIVHFSSSDDPGVSMATVSTHRSEGATTAWGKFAVSQGLDPEVVSNGGKKMERRREA